MIFKEIFMLGLFCCSFFVVSVVVLVFGILIWCVFVVEFSFKVVIG